jgi:hypothetical protein
MGRGTAEEVGEGRSERRRRRGDRSLFMPLTRYRGSCDGRKRDGE